MPPLLKPERKRRSYQKLGKERNLGATVASHCLHCNLLATIREAG